MIAAAIQLVVLMVVFTLVEARWPATQAHRWWRRPLLVDICSWLIHPLSISAGITLALAAVNKLLLAIPNDGGWLAFATFRAHLASFSPLTQMPLAIVIADFLSYWIHRAYHRFPMLWAFHIVHHTSEELDWLSTSRLHPVSQILNTTVIGIVLLTLGLPTAAVVAANVFIGAAALLVHANVNWTFGPLRHLLVSPIFHQWHHAKVEDEGRDHGVGNYGAAFSIWDRLFGTWHLPGENRPVSFGVQHAPPLTVLGLALHPLHRCLRFFSGRRDKSAH